MNYSPDALAVRKLDWDFFCTLTHKKGGFSHDADGIKVFHGGRWESPSKKRQADIRLGFIGFADPLKFGHVIFFGFHDWKKAARVAAIIFTLLSG